MKDHTFEFMPKRLHGKNLPFRLNRPLQGLILLYALFWGWMAVLPYNRFDWLLENLLIFTAVATLAITYRKFVFSTGSYTMFVLFLALHTVGAHYSYNTTPLDTFMHQIFSLQRDPYDRIVHFSFGLLLVYPTREFIRQVIGVHGTWAHTLAIAVIMACAAFYELIEMWVAHIVAPEIGTLFLGTQGDSWDTQRDMEVALYGAVLTTYLSAMIRRKRRGEA